MCLRLAKLRGGRKALAQRRHAEIDEGVLEPLAAMPAAKRFLADVTEASGPTPSILASPKRLVTAATAGRGR